MPATGTEIQEFIPQRAPMIMVDRILSCHDLSISTGLLLKEDNVFMHDHQFAPAGIMEAMAQAAAARTGWLLRNSRGNENKNVPVGVIGSIKNFKLHFQPVAGMNLITNVEIMFEIGNATVVRAKSEVEGQLAAEAELQIFLTGTEPQDQ